MTECLLIARRELGPDAEIVGQRKVKKGAWFGRWGGREVIEVTCRIVEDPLPAPRRASLPDHTQTAQLQTLETRLADLTNSVQGLVDAAGKKPFRSAPVASATGEERAEPRERREGGGTQCKGPA